MQLEMPDKSLKNLVIAKKDKNLKRVFLNSNANSLPPNRNEDPAIELKPRKTPIFDSIYNFSEHQLEVLRESLIKTLPIDSFVLQSFWAEHLPCLL